MSRELKIVLSTAKLIGAFLLSSIYWVLTVYLVLQSPLSFYPWIESVFPWTFNAICKPEDFLCTHWNSRDPYRCIDMICVIEYISRFLLYAYVPICVCVCHGSCVETMGQLAGVSFVLPPCESGLLAYIFTHQITLLAPGRLFWLSFVLGAGDKWDIYVLRKWIC